MRTGKRPLLLLVMAFVLLAVTACGQSASTDSGSASSPAGNKADAKPTLIYKQSCASCHAVDLSGKVGPSLQEIGSKLSEEEIFEAISSGRPGMPPFEKRLKTEEIHALAAWLANHTASDEGADQ
ncbi:cytochrome c [Paenibacillus sp. FSL W8-0186]|uniref:Cytochrome c domain-containing protein n=1 Tax=Paenibacillus woosongensis TaxID=307580 RepID=A0ABQ4MLZ2_9BACL|nr:cytochrome c [Paenibacillus woosongensis]GIP57003.1 hypothetical protein J15TS10_08170 [Paenibacillus woosongensis]